MSNARIFLLYACACALAVIAVYAAPALPVRSDNKGSKMVQEETIVVRRLPNAYFYPFSLWPLPKYQVRDEDPHESFPYRRNYNIKRQNER
ncbi:hypothetical protein PYW08_002872 [Mythimna loreyi]|uniref:Uncharacterized protein n=1 Tax=Mythimna loreyi TaxID=667449 RepID=A0ACC2QLN8_9NEOP|nr:hypothetical protein PYW08_002872 [Mythimna loreyi]